MNLLCLFQIWLALVFVEPTLAIDCLPLQRSKYSTLKHLFYRRARARSVQGIVLWMNFWSLALTRPKVAAYTYYACDAHVDVNWIVGQPTLLSHQCLWFGSFSFLEIKWLETNWNHFFCWCFCSRRKLPILLCLLILAPGILYLLSRVSGGISLLWGIRQQYLLQYWCSMRLVHTWPKFYESLSTLISLLLETLNPSTPLNSVG